LDDWDQELRSNFFGPTLQVPDDEKGGIETKGCVGGREGSD
jgi:hypothetical protein